MSDSTGGFSDLLPWSFVTKFHEGVVVQKDGVLQRTFAYRAPDVDSSSDLEINALAVRVNDFAKRLGSGWAFQFEAQRFQIREYPAARFDRLAPYLVDREREASFRDAGRHFDSSFYLTFVWKPPPESIKKLTSLFVNSGSDGAGMTMKQNVEFFAGESDSAASLLANNLLLAPLDNNETVEYLHSSVSFKRHPVSFPHTQIMLDRVLPDSVLENSLPMKLGDHFIPIVGVNDFPQDTYPAILDSLNRARLEYRWVTRFICLDREAGKKEAQKKEKSHRGSRKSFLQTFAEATSGEPARALNHGAGVKENDSIDAGIEIDNDEASLGYLTTCVMVWDPSLKTAMRKADLVKTIVNSNGFTCRDEKYNALESFQSMMPGQVYANYHALPVMSYTMSHIVPLSSVWAGFRVNEHALRVTGVGEPHVTCATDEGTPFFLNLAVGDVGHSSILGPTGAGKSTLLNLLEMQAFKYPGSLVVVFDKGGSCRQACLSVGGLFYEPAGENSAGISFQPLRDLETDRDVLDAMDFIETCVAVGGGTVTSPMRDAVKKSLGLMRELPAGRRTLTSFIHYSDYQDPDTGKPVLRELLGDYLWEGKYGKIFDDRASGFSLDTRFLVVEMESLMNRGENCVVPALVYLFGLVEKKFDGRLTLLVLDEAWLFLKNETFAGKITEWLKVLRKKNVYVVFATQELSDIAKSSLKDTIIQQCFTKIYLANPWAQTPAMAPVYRSFGLTDAETELVSKSEMKRDYFYTSPAGRRLFQLDLGPLTLALIGSPDHRLLDGLASAFEPGSPLCAQILSAKNFDFGYLLGEDAPHDPAPALRQRPPAPVTRDGETPAPEIKTEPAGLPQSSKHAEFLRAVASLPDKKNNGGSGRAAAAVAELYGVSLSTVYQARKILKEGTPELVDAFRKDEIPVKTAYKNMLREKSRPHEQAG